MAKVSDLSNAHGSDTCFICLSRYPKQVRFPGVEICTLRVNPFYSGPLWARMVSAWQIIKIECVGRVVTFVLLQENCQNMRTLDTQLPFEGCIKRLRLG